MRNTIAIVVSFAALTLLHGCAKPDPKAEAQKAIQASYAAADAAVPGKNIDTILANYAPDCVFIAPNGKESKGSDMNRASLQTLFAIPNMTVKRTTTITDLALDNSKGDQVTVTVSQLGEVSLGGTSQKITTVMRDHWVKGAQGWKINREKLVSMKKG